MPRQNACVSIGNSDDKLTQREWSSFWHSVNQSIGLHAATIHGAWVSQSTSPFQSASWWFEIDETQVVLLTDVLARAAKFHRQDAIAWMTGVVAMIGPGMGVRH